MTSARTLIIAEAGVNHNGDLDMARALIDRAAEAGADYVKFQSFRAEQLVTAHARQAEYQSRNMGQETSQLQMLQALELSQAAHHELIDHCHSRKIGFLSTAFDPDSLNFLAGLGLDLHKIPSGEITNLPMLRSIGQTRRRILLSTGMATLGEIEAAIEALETAGSSRDQITLLQCTTEYPCPPSEVNLRAMVTLGQAFGTAIGYSDHTAGIEVPLAAVALGACVIEKHFTLDRSLPGPDHQASLEPEQLHAMVQSIRTIELAMGSPLKRPTPSESKNRHVARKSLVASRLIRAGELFTPDNVTTKRPGSGLSPMLWDSVIGTLAGRDYRPDEMIER